MLNYDQVYAGDCLDVMPQIDKRSINLILCDLPQGKTDDPYDVQLPFEPLWKHYQRIRTEDCVVVLFGSEPFASHLRLSNLENYRYDWIWHKSKPSGLALAQKQPMRNHEPILVFYQGKFYPIKEKREGFTESSIKAFTDGGVLGTYRNHGDSVTNLGKTELKEIEELRFPTTIRRVASVPNRLGTLHPTQKPLELLEYLIRTYTDEGDVVLDNCAGSGGTGLAAANLKRNFILIEKDPKYVEVCRERIQTFPQLF